MLTLYKVRPKVFKYCWGVFLVLRDVETLSIQPYCLSEFINVITAYDSIYKSQRILTARRAVQWDVFVSFSSVYKMCKKKYKKRTRSFRHFPISTSLRPFSELAWQQLVPSKR